MKVRGSKTVKLLSIFSLRAGGISFCPCLNLRSLVSFALISLLAIGSVSFAATEYKETPLKVSATDIADFDLIMKNDPRAVSKEQFEVRQRNYWAGQMAHKDRLMQYMLDLRENKEFAKRFPEESKIVKQYFPELLKLTGEHDRRKFHIDIRAANEIMVKAQGINMRDALAGKDPHLSPYKAKRIGQMMKDSVNDYNSGEAKGVNQVIEEITDSLKKRGLPDDEVRRVLDVLNVQVEVKDYYDTGAMRSKEFGKPLQGAYDWIQTLEKKENAFDLSSERAKKLHEYRKGMAAFADEWHPIGQNAEKYATAADYLKIQTKDFKTDYIKHFEAKEKRLIAQAFKDTPKITLARSPLTAKPALAKGADAAAEVASTSGEGAATVAGKTAGVATAATAAVRERVAPALRTAGKFAKNFAKGTVVGGAAMGVANYAISAEKTNLTDTLATIVTAGEMFACDTVGCQSFLTECQDKIIHCGLKLPAGQNGDQCIQNFETERKQHGAPSRTFAQSQEIEKLVSMKTVQEHKYFGELCVKPFLKLPLNQQNLARQDHALSRILDNYVPSVHNLTCYKKEKGAMAVHVELLNSQDTSKNYYQRIQFNEKSKVSKVERIFARDGEGKDDNLLFENSKAARLQHCAPNQTAYAGKCRMFEMEHLQNLGLYFWRDDRLATPSGKLEGRVPVDAVKWARANQQLIEMQSSLIQSCCDDNSCQKYFADKEAKFHDTAIKNRTNLRFGTRAADANGRP